MYPWRGGGWRRALDQVTGRCVAGSIPGMDRDIGFGCGRQGVINVQGDESHYGEDGWDDEERPRERGKAKVGTTIPALLVVPEGIAPAMRGMPLWKILFIRAHRWPSQQSCR
jgi:hypothetical protein